MVWQIIQHKNMINTNMSLSNPTFKTIIITMWNSVETHGSTGTSLQAHGAVIPNAFPWFAQVLPKIEVQPFDGTASKWPDFIGMFKSLVHDKLTSDSDQLAILRQCLMQKTRNSNSDLLKNLAMYRQALQ